MYVCCGDGPLPGALPSPKSHSNVIGSPSGSFEPALEKLTVSGASPEEGVADATAVGGVFPDRELDSAELVGGDRQVVEKAVRPHLDVDRAIGLLGEVCHAPGHQDVVRVDRSVRSQPSAKSPKKNAPWYSAG